MIPQSGNGLPPVIAVVGPTASGKTALGIEIAKAFGGEVVSADSMQLYEGLDLATAKPTPEEMQGIPHHLISILPPDHPCSVAEYTELARDIIAQIQARGKLPVVVGGTGLYADSLLDNIRFSDIPADPALRAKLHQQAEEQGPAAMLELLRGCDPETAERLHENNLRRVIRALEVYTLTGIPLSEHARRSRAVPPPWNVLRIGLSFSDRALLYDRIRLRADKMVENGLADEVSEEFHSGRRRETAAMAIGYKELLPWLRGEEPFAEGIARVKQETCRYAKRQETWFRRNEQICRIWCDGIRTNAEIFEISKKIIAKSNLL